MFFKNAVGLLPLKSDVASLAVIGPTADRIRYMFGDYAYTSMADLMDGGEQPPDKTQYLEKLPPMVSVLETVRGQGAPTTVVRYVPRCDYRAESREGFAEAVELAGSCTIAVLGMGGRLAQMEMSTTSECRDPADLGLPSVQEELIEAVLATGTAVVLVLVDGRPAAVPELIEQIPAASCPPPSRARWGRCRFITRTSLWRGARNRRITMWSKAPSRCLRLGMG